MQVILQEDIPNLGDAGDIVTVKDGYGRNFLLPNEKAVIADQGNMKQLAHNKRVVAAKQQKVKIAAESIAKKLKGISISLERESGDEGKLFGSVTSSDIASMLSKQGVDVDRHKIRMESPLKEIGNYDVTVRLHSEVSGNIKVSVVKK